MEVTEASTTTGADFLQWRTTLGLSQPQAGALLGISRYQVCRIEADRAHWTPSLRLLCWLLQDGEIRKRLVTHVGMRHIPGSPL